MTQLLAAVTDAAALLAAAAVLLGVAHARLAGHAGPEPDDSPDIALAMPPPPLRRTGNPGNGRGCAIRALPQAIRVFLAIRPGFCGAGPQYGRKPYPPPVVLPTL
jgi:hypothetical protein